MKRILETFKYLSSLLILALPIMGAALSSIRSSVEVGDHAGAKEYNGETILGGSPLLDPSYVIEGIPGDIFIPPAVRMTGAAHALDVSKSLPHDFWEMAKRSEESWQEHVHNLLESGATHFKLDKFTDIISTTHHIVSATATFRDDISGALDFYNITLDMLSQELEGIFVAVMDDLRNIPPPDKAPGHAERLELVDKILNRTIQGVAGFAAPYGLEEKFSAFLSDLKPHVQALVVTVGDINQQHPALLRTLAITIAIQFIPESWILRPVLELFGFGPKGPVKGSAAAWLQSSFWGAAVEADSWFAWLQAAGMRAITK